MIVWHSGELIARLNPTQAIDLRTVPSDQQPSVLIDHLRLIRERDSKRTGYRAERLPDPIQKPAINSASDVVDFARYNFDVGIEQYDASLKFGNSMQRNNATRLLDMLCEHYCENDIATLHGWVDAGCGSGLVGSIIKYKADSHCPRSYEPLQKARIRAGFDYSPRTVAYARRNNDSRAYTDIFRADLRNIEPGYLQKKTGTSWVDLVIANDVLHWLFTPDAIARAMRNCRNMLRDQGLLAMTIASSGTGRIFFEAYHKVLSGVVEADAAMNECVRGVWSAYTRNPIGMQSLSNVVRCAQVSGLRVVEAIVRYEPVTYSSTEGYVNDVISYGDQILMAPLADCDEKHRHDVWRRIGSEFKAAHESEIGPGKYVHDQFVIYLIAQRVQDRRNA
ncbi:MAG: class I SAM-dependent methyltransferase [Bacteroidetes bacterium]|nr:class I SAM-dependent methyltransferase [Bacteroidota bacterium]